MAADVVLEWNDVIADAIRADTTMPGPTWASRNYAMLHVAIYDAVNGIAGGHAPFACAVPGPAGASLEAAAAAAAHSVLVGLYPDQTARFDAVLHSTLEAIPDGYAEDAGVAYGQQVASVVLASREHDGAHDPMPYTSKLQPGYWRPTPDDYTPALSPGWGRVKPFAIDDPANYRVPSPPALDSVEYADALEEVRRLGEKNSPYRTVEQTEVGMFWGYDRAGVGPPLILYNQIAQTVAMQMGNSMLENARLFALVNIAQADAGIVAWDNKYFHDFWRPVTAIHQAHTDGNPLTVADPNWEPLGAPGPDPFTPPFPAYTSGHATFGAAMFRTLERFYGTDEVTFTIGSDELPGVTRTFNRFSDAAEENGQSRIYLGIHYEFDKTFGIAGGVDVADLVFERYLRPLTHTTIGLYSPDDSWFFLRHEQSPGLANHDFGFGPPGSRWQVVMGDFNGDGIDTPTLFNGATGTFFVKNDHATGPADFAFQFGPAGAEWVPVAGDWDGDGRDTIALYDPASSSFFYTNSNGPGSADGIAQFGPAGCGWVPLAGDFNGDGVDTVALYDPQTSTFFYKNSLLAGAADGFVQYGPASEQWTPLVGDWNADGRECFSLYDPARGKFFIKDTMTGGAADWIVQFGPGGQAWIPLAGHWQGLAGQPILAAAGAGNAVNATRVDHAALDTIVDAGLHRLAGAGVGEAALARLASIDFLVLDLPGAMLGLYTTDAIYVDIDAAGHGWYLDPTPALDETFAATADGARLTAEEDSAAAGGMDLLSVALHEFGHALGLQDLDPVTHAGHLMVAELETGTRLLPVLDELFATDAWQTAHFISRGK